MKLSYLCIGFRKQIYCFGGNTAATEVAADSTDVDTVAVDTVAVDTVAADTTVVAE